MKRAISGFFCAVILAASVTAADELGADFEALKRYEFGQDRSALTRIETAALNAAQSAAVEAGLIDVLDNAHSADAKRFACRLLQVRGTAACVPALERQLPDAQLRPHAIRALEALDAPEGAAALRRAAGSGSGGLRVAAMEALGRKRDDAALPVLTQALSDEEDAVAVAAAFALGKYGSDEACDALFAAWEGAQGARRADFARALLDGAVLLGARGDAKAAQQHLQALFDSNEASGLRAAALHGLVALDGAKALGRVTAALTSEDAEMFAAGLRHVRTLEGKKATDAFAALLGEARPHAQVPLIAALADRGDRAAGEAVQRLTASPEPSVQLAAIRALGSLGDRHAVELLVRLCAENKGEVLRTARTSLYRLVDAEADKTLQALAKRGEKKGRLEAIGALGERRAVLAKGELLALAQDSDPEIRSEALEAFQKLSDAADVPTLLALLPKSADEEHRRAIERAVAATCNRIEGVERAAAVLTALGGGGLDSAGRISHYRILGAVVSAASYDALVRGLEEAEDTVRGVVVAALAKYPGDAQVPLLLNVARAPRNEDERANALKGVITKLNAQARRDAALLAMYQELLPLAKNHDEKKQILGGVGTIPLKASLEVIQSVSGADFEAERMLATVKLAQSLIGAYPEWAMGLVGPAQESENQAVRSQALLVAGAFKRAQNYLTAWEVSGPYKEADKTGGMLIDVHFPPEQGGGEWQIQPLCVKPDYPAGGLNLAETFGAFECVAYLRTSVVSPAAMDAVLSLGTNDGCKVWVNGEELFATNVGRPLIPGQDKIPVKLKAGPNTILIAVYQQGGEWGAVASLEDKSGSPLTGVTNQLLGG